MKRGARTRAVTLAAVAALALTALPGAAATRMLSGRAVGGSSSAAAGHAPLAAFRGLGTWVDLYDTPERADPQSTVAAMHGHGVRTLFLETSNFRSSEDVVSPTTVSLFITAAHAAGMRVVAWYLPSFASSFDYRRCMAAIHFRTADRQGFDGFALDIESAVVTDVSLRTTRLLSLARRVRAGAGSAYPLGAIVPAPRGMQLTPTYWPGFPFRSLRPLFDVFLPMGYFTYHTRGELAAHDYTAANVYLLRTQTGDRAVPIHAIGGLADAATAAEVTGFVQAERERGLLGASLYDFSTTSAEEWSILSTVPANPRQTAVLPRSLPDASPLGNIPGGDRSHPKEVFYRATSASKPFVVAFRAFDVQAGEVQLWVNWHLVATLAPTSPGAWSHNRQRAIPAEDVNSAGPNEIQFVAAGSDPHWSIWGVRDVSLGGDAGRSP